MGCNNSTESAAIQQSPQHRSICWKDDTTGETKTLTSANHNEAEIDISHFSKGQEALGVGGFGLVRHVTKVTGPDKGAEYAMKSMSKDAILKRTSGPSSVSTELRCLIMLTESQFVCRLHYAFQSPSHLFMILELARGGDLRCCLRATQRSRFSEAAARHIMCQIFLGLTHCHRISILHRDVKPENLLMTGAGVVKLSDFGVAKILPDVEDCRSTSGTHGYMAPEVYVGSHQHGTASEWFSAGITLHELLTGRRPFEATRLQAFRYCRGWASSADAERYAEDLVSSCLPSARTVADALWPEFLFGQGAEGLSADCKNFVRALLIPDPAVRLGGYRRIDAEGGEAAAAAAAAADRCEQEWGLSQIKQHPWLRGVRWDELEGTPGPELHRHSALAEEFPTADPQRIGGAPAQGANKLGLRLSSGAWQFLAAGEDCEASSLPAGCSTAGNREEMRRALHAHLQAPAVSPSQQYVFRHYAYRNRLQQESSSGEYGSPHSSSAGSASHALVSAAHDPQRAQSARRGSNGIGVDTSSTTAAAYVSPLQRRPPKIYFAPRHKGSRLGSRRQRGEDWKEGEDVDVVVIQQDRDPYHVFSPHGSGSGGTH